MKPSTDLGVNQCTGTGHKTASCIRKVVKSPSCSCKTKRDVDRHSASPKNKKPWEGSFWTDKQPDGNNIVEMIFVHSAPALIPLCNYMCLLSSLFLSPSFLLLHLAGSCNYFLFLKLCASGSVTGRKTDKKMEYTHYLWDFIELYF